MSENVIILGAGFSHAAGIPLMSGFVDTMWEIGIRGAWNGKDISDADRKIFTDAIKVRHGLNGFHGRAHFDDRNIEDILSLLTFGVLAGEEAASEHLKAVNRAIARTIELTCEVKHPGAPKNEGEQCSSIRNGPEMYRTFWKRLINWAAEGKSPPTIITFNYDLVLERSLLQVLIGTGYYDGQTTPLPRKNICLNYHYDKAPRLLHTVKYTGFTNHRDFGHTPGTLVTRSDADDSDSVLEFDLLKLHGSLNFSQTKPAKTDFNIAAAVDDPFILPPIFNKLSGTAPSKMWQTAIQRVQQAKNLIIVGYSLPRTDIYMQYFLKSALGPNLDFNRLYVFDPVLYENNGQAKALKERYEECFSPQMKQRISFWPESAGSGAGTAAHFVEMLSRNKSGLFF